MRFGRFKIATRVSTIKKKDEKIMKVSKIYDFLDTCYDFNCQESWDQSGLISFGDKEEDINHAIVALDINSDVIEYAISHKIHLIVTHHPLLASELEDEKSPAHGFVKKLYQNKINVISIHTPFDKDVNGMNVALAQNLGLVNIKRLNQNNRYVITGRLQVPVQFGSFAKQAAKLLGSDYARYNEVFKNKRILNVAICGGSGGSFISEVAATKGVDAYITCDMKYHAWNDAYELKLPVIDLNHEIEKIFIGVVAKKLKELSPSLAITRYTTHLNTTICKIKA